MKPAIVLSDGIKMISLKFDRHDTYAEGEAFIIDLDKVDIENSVEREIVERDFIDQSVSPNDANGMGKTIKEMIESAPPDRDILIAFNGIIGGFWEVNSAAIIGGELIIKPHGVRGLFQETYAPLNGTFWVLSLDSGCKGLFEVKIKNGKLPADCSIKNGLFGPPAFLMGRNMIDYLQFGIRPNLEGNQVIWHRDQRSAMSAIGYDMDGKLVRVALKGDPDDKVRKELSIDELADILEKFGMVDAIFAGTSADVQTYNSFLDDNEFTCAAPRAGSITGKIWPRRGRPVASRICVYAKTYHSR